eukprot:gene11444-4609_t
MSVEDAKEAICDGNIIRLGELISNGFEINEEYDYLGCYKSYGDCIPWTPLQYAAAVGNQNIIDFLIENGADFSIVDETNRNAQEIADFLGKNVDVKKIYKRTTIKRENLFNEKII